MTAASDQSCQLERHVAADLHDRIFVHQHLLGERRQIEKLMHQLSALPAQPGRFSGQHLHIGVGADHRAARRAVVAGAAEHRQTRHDVIAGLHIGDVRADLLDDTGRLVAEHGGEWMRVKAFDEMQIGMTKAGDLGADQHLARPGFLQSDILDRERTVGLVQNGGLHDVSPLRVTPDTDRCLSKLGRAV